MNLTKKELEAAKQNVLHIEKVLNLLCDSCEEQAKKFNSQSIPIDYVKQASRVIIEGYKEGLPKEKFSDKVRKMNPKK